MITRPRARWDRARRRMNGSAISAMWIVVISGSRTRPISKRILQGQPIDHSCSHAHIMGCGFLDDLRAPERGAPEDIPAADDDRQFDPLATPPARPAGRSG